MGRVWCSTRVRDIRGKRRREDASGYTYAAHNRTLRTQHTLPTTQLPGPKNSFLNATRSYPPPPLHEFPVVQPNPKQPHTKILTPSDPKTLYARLQNPLLSNWQRSALRARMPRGNKDRREEYRFSSTRLRGWAGCGLVWISANEDRRGGGREEQEHMFATSCVQGAKEFPFSHLGSIALDL